MAMHIGNPWVVSMNGVDDNTNRFLASTAILVSTDDFRTECLHMHCTVTVSKRRELRRSGGRAEH